MMTSIPFEVIARETEDQVFKREERLRNYRPPLTAFQSYEELRSYVNNNQKVPEGEFDIAQEELGTEDPIPNTTCSLLLVSSPKIVGENIFRDWSVTSIQFAPLSDLRHGSKWYADPIQKQLQKKFWFVGWRLRKGETSWKPGFIDTRRVGLVSSGISGEGAIFKDSEDAYSYFKSRLR